MSIRLTGLAGSFRFDLPGWYFIQELAADHGWEPAGTLAPDDWEEEAEEEWDGGYLSPDGQQVTDEDAGNLADALERALGDIPDHDARVHKPAGYPLPRAMIRLLRDMPGDNPPPGPEQCLNAREWFSGKRKQAVRDFIAFCQRGSFTIR